MIGSQTPRAVPNTVRGRTKKTLMKEDKIEKNCHVATESNISWLWTGLHSIYLGMAVIFHGSPTLSTIHQSAAIYCIKGGGIIFKHLHVEPPGNL